MELYICSVSSSIKENGNTYHVVVLAIPQKSSYSASIKMLIFLKPKVFHQNNICYLKMFFSLAVSYKILQISFGVF